MVNELAKQILAKLEKLPDVALQAGVAYAGSRATRHWSGGLLGLIGLKLAQAPNIPAGLAGIGILAGLGLSAFVDSNGNVSPPPIPQIGAPVSGVGAGGGGYIPPPIDTGPVLMPISECLQRGGSIVQTYPMTTNCLCQLPDVPPPLGPAPPGAGGGGGVPPKRAII